jgi:hypothetical protein
MKLCEGYMFCDVGYDWLFDWRSHASYVFLSKNDNYICISNNNNNKI